MGLDGRLAGKDGEHAVGERAQSLRVALARGTVVPSTDHYLCKTLPELQQDDKMEQAEEANRALRRLPNATEWSRRMSPLG